MLTFTCLGRNVNQLIYRGPRLVRFLGPGRKPYYAKLVVHRLNSTSTNYLVTNSTSTNFIPTPY